jgi:L-asparaginase
MAQSKILLLSLGGTITMTRGASGAIAPTLGADDLARAVPGIEAVAAIETASPLRVPGASLTLEDLISVAALVDERLAGGADGVVVIQGTDTIEETAFVLDLLVRSDRPVVVTGAMRGPEAPGADGPANVLAATTVAASAEAAGLGALVVLNDEIHAARFAQKGHTALPSAFGSPGAGPVGLVAEGRAILRARPPRARRVEGARAGVDAPVALLKMALGEDGRMLAALPGLGYRGAVVEGMGAGHVPAAVAPLLADLASTMPVVLGARVPAGPVFTRTYGFPGSETDLIGKGLIPSGLLGGVKARLLLSLLLRCGLPPEDLRARFAEHAAA